MVRGELAVGSSPHARGTPCAAASSGRSRSVHPRMRGEHDRYAEHELARVGSSPHARGTLPGRVGPYPHVRFIPACAGNTMGGPDRLHVAAVHPRMRGEHWKPACLCRERAGSSPHARIAEVWAARGLVAPVHPRLRGEHESKAIRPPTPVHPRMRGEHSPAARSRLRPVHPRMRGEHLCQPSGAGRTVHPRMRGKHSAVIVKE